MGRIRTINLRRKKPGYKPEPPEKLSNIEICNLALEVFGDETDEANVKLCNQARELLKKEAEKASL